ncbi:microcystin-dependent protein [Paucimonas lemoignei]|uniref:Microcystin-dependent protein n=1 Tax=Paucimonas lemoignei TaxID=29443 RepID=A0A4R3HW46_PAULE|nr:tail fiber protein [Paucimonas lemoignei]TCS37496.1 microcystin-dependent protein [Paucimonas lemoignei]
MRRISTATKQVDKFGAGKHGFRDGDPVNAISATDLEAQFFDHVQEELCAIVEAAGGAADGSSRSQVVNAILSLIAANGSAPGKVAYFAMSSAPAGYLKANGALVSRTTYAALFAAISTTFGAGDGVTTFKLPDLRGEFIRGWSDGAGVDSGRVFGSAQTDAMQGHVHPGWANATAASATDTPAGAGGTQYTGIINNPSTGNPATDGVNGTPRTAAETRPRNIALLACIKY